MKRFILWQKEKVKGDGIYTYLLHKFEGLKLINKIFDKGDFDFTRIHQSIFGVLLYGETLEVELLFSPELAPEAEKYNFYPTQEGNITTTEHIQ